MRTYVTKDQFVNVLQRAGACTDTRTRDQMIHLRLVQLYRLKIVRENPFKSD